MRTRIVLDTGPITLYFSKKPPIDIENLMHSAQQGEIEAEVASPTLVEVFNQICISKGKEKALQSQDSLATTIPVAVIQLDQDLIARAGALKCQYRKQLSYIDCIAISLAQRDKAIFHTTEKELDPLHIPHLKVKKYAFAKKLGE